MQLSQTAEYALRAVVYLAGHARDPQTNQQIADGCRMPAGYLAKVLQPLVKGGVVTAQRGLGGGYLLALDAERLTLLEVIEAVEPVQRIRGCPLKLGEHGSRLCKLHEALDDAMAGVIKALGGRTVGSVLTERMHRSALCSVEPSPVPLGLDLVKGDMDLVKGDMDLVKGDLDHLGDDLRSSGTEATPDPPE
jgi:Rrf2 family transcriptional regulator, nitric oxide-sensitive transcriptional repressor